MYYVRWETRLHSFRIYNPRLGYGTFFDHHMWTYLVLVIINFLLGAWNLLQRAYVPVFPSFTVSSIWDAYHELNVSRLLSIEGMAVVIVFGISLHIVVRAWIHHGKFVFRHEQNTGV